MLGAMRAADPFGTFTLADEIPRSADFVLHIGRHLPTSAVVVIDAAGWYASCGGSDLAAAGEGLPSIGAAGAACLGVAEVFRRAVGLRPMEEPFVLDLHRLAPGFEEVAPPPREDLGRVLLVGAGSVGSAVAYVAACCGFRGDWMVVDHDKVKIENFNRGLLFDRTTYAEPKAAVVADFLGCHRSVAEPFAGTFDEFVCAKGLLRWRDSVWVPVANEFGVRRSVQRNLPPVMTHASTSPNWTVNFGRHVPGRDDCLLCRFPVDPIADAALACSTVSLPSSGAIEPVDAALPFASALAGVLIVAELARLAATTKQPTAPNYVLFDLYQPGFALWTAQRRPLETCDCGRDELTSVLVNQHCTVGKRIA
jgi:ThiF family